MQYMCLQSLQTTLCGFVQGTDAPVHADDIKAGLSAHFVKSYDEILKLALLPDGLLQGN